MKKLTSKKTNETQLVSDDVWRSIVSKGWKDRFMVSDVPSKKVNPPPEVNKEDSNKSKKTEK